MGKPGMGIAPGWIKSNAGWLYERVAPGGSGSCNAPPADGKSERNKRSPTYKKSFAYFAFEQARRKKFSWSRFWVGKEILSEKESPRHKTFAGFVFKESWAKKVFMEQILGWKGNIK